MLRTALISLLLLSAPAASQAAAPDRDTCTHADIYDTGPQSTDTIERRQGFVKRFIAYFDKSNKTCGADYGRFDISVIGGPHYSSDTKLGLGVMAAGQYRCGRRDSLALSLPPSNIAVYTDVTSSGFYTIGIRGINIFPRDFMRLQYDTNLYSSLTYYWGCGYKMNNNNSNKSKYNEFGASANVAGLFRLARALYLGPALEVSYAHAGKVKRPELWRGQALGVTTPGVGLDLHYDTRDNLTGPTRGWLLELSQRFYPRFLGNKYAFSATEASANCYYGVWRGGVVASRVHARWAYGNVPWCRMSEMGDRASMRGYYPGRYNDKLEADLTVELRQHIWRRSGAVAWVGAGTVAPSPRGLRMRHVLPNAGVGYRWEFKRNTNVRIDVGFGRRCVGFTFNINEAF